MTSWISSIIESFSYPGIIFLMFIENVFPPIPSELIMPLAGYVSERGGLSLAGVILAGTTGSVLGSLPLYYAGRVAGEERLKRWLDRHGRWLAMSGDDVDKATRWFDRHGSKTVLLCRVVPGVRSLISIPAGLAGMSMPSFLAYTTIGSAAWTAALAWAGQRLGQNYAQVEKFLGPVSLIVVGAIVLSVVVRALRLHRRKAGPP